MAEADLALRRAGRRREQRQEFFHDLPQDAVVFEQPEIDPDEALEDNGVGEQLFSG